MKLRTIYSDQFFILLLSFYLTYFLSYFFHYGNLLMHSLLYCSSFLLVKTKRAIISHTCARMPTITFFALMIIFTFTLTGFIIHFWFELHVVLLNLYLQSHSIWFCLVLVSFLFVFILNALTFTSFVSFL